MVLFVSEKKNGFLEWNKNAGFSKKSGDSSYVSV